MKKSILALISIVSVLTLVIPLQKKAFASWILNSNGEIIFLDAEVLGQKVKPVVADTLSDDDSQEETEEGEDPEDKSKGDENANINKFKEKINVNTQTLNGNPSSVTFDVKDSKLKVKVKTENGSEIELPEGTDEGEEFEIEESTVKTSIKVKAYGDSFALIKDKVGAKTNFPLMVNLETNELMVTTPKGTKIVTVLPDKAVEHMLAGNVLDQLGGKGGLQWLAYQEQLRQSTQSTQSNSGDNEGNSDEDSNESTESTGSVQMNTLQTREQVEAFLNMVATEDGTLAYEIEGFKEKKLFNMFRINLARTAVVSAETGELLSIEQDFITRILDMLSR